MVKTTATSQNELASTAKPAGTPPEKNVFMGAAIGMSWQLALVVLLPILGGYKLDTVNGSSPLWTVIGLVMALILSVLVVRNALKSVNNFSLDDSAVTSEDRHA